MKSGQAWHKLLYSYQCIHWPYHLMISAMTTPFDWPETYSTITVTLINTLYIRKLKIKCRDLFTVYKWYKKSWWYYSICNSVRTLIIILWQFRSLNKVYPTYHLHRSHCGDRSRFWKECTFSEGCALLYCLMNAVTALLELLTALSEYPWVNNWKEAHAPCAPSHSSLDLTFNCYYFIFIYYIYYR